MSNGFVDMAILSEINRQRTKDAHETWKRKKEENSLGDQLRKHRFIPAPLPAEN